MSRASNQLPNPDDYARKRINGEKKTNREIATLVAQLLQGNNNQNKRPMTMVEISQKLFIHTDTISKFKNLAISLKLLESKDGKWIKPELSDLEKFQKFQDKDEFCNNPDIKKWIEKNSTRRDGEPLASIQDKVNAFKQICNTLQVNPKAFITGNNVTDILEHSDELIGNYVKLYSQGKATIPKREGVDLEIFRYRHAQAMRSFMSAFGFQYPKNYGGNVGQNVKVFHGKYSDVKLSEEQLQEAKKYIIENWGIDSDVFRWFFFGIESCARADAIHKAKSMYQKIPFRGGQAYLFIVYESKTRQIKGGLRKKYITDEDLKKSLDLVAKRSDFIIEKRGQLDKNDIYSKIKQVWKFLRVDKLHLKNQNNDTTGYFMNHTSHALRHIGCQLWMRRFGYGSMELVALMGDWSTIDEAKKSYGEIPEEQILLTVETAWK